MSFWDIILAVAPELILAFGATELLLQAAWGKDKERTYRTVSITCIVLLVLATLSLLGPAHHAGEIFNGQYRADQFAAFAKALIFIASIIAIVMAPRFFRRHGELQAEYPVIILFSAIGMGIMVSAGDLLMLYVGLELQSLAAYVLAGFLRRDARASEAALKYFVLGALASGILLYGISLLYGFSGTTLFSGIAASLAEGVSTGHLFGIVFVLAGLAFKVSAVPFHMWTPDVYEGAPTPVTAFFASAPKVAAMALLARVAIEAMGPAAASWQQIVIFMALASTILGGVAAIGQTSLKRLLAYSSINNVGFALVGLAAASPEGISALLFYMAVYVVMTLGTFLVVLAIADEQGRPVERIDALAGLSRTRPGMAAAMMIFMFSLAGIPPLMGFWPKLAVFQAAVGADLAWLAAVAIATSVIGAYYYLKIIKIMYFDDVAEGIAPVRDRLAGALILLAALLVSPLGMFGLPLIDFAAANAAGALF